MLDELLSLRADSQLLASLTEAELRELYTQLEEVECAGGDFLMRTGDPGDRMYVIVSGRMAVMVVRGGKEEQVIREMGPGEVVGEVALVVGGERTASVRALETCRLVSLSRARFENLLKIHPVTSRRVSQLVLERLQLSHLAPQLCRIFGPMPLEVLHKLEAEIEWLTLEAGQDLVRRGSPADAVYVVVSGRLRAVLETPDGDEQVLNEIGPGEPVGEIELLTGGPRVATAYAVRDSSLARLSSEAFSRLIDRYPQAMFPISQIMVERLLRQGLAEPPPADAHTIALIPTGPGAPLHEVATGLVRQLAVHGPVAHVTSADVDHALFKTGIAQTSTGDASGIRLAQWLAEKEATFRYVVYQADASWGPWSDRCVRQADQLLIVADAAANPAPGAAEERIAGRVPRARAPRRSLLLLHRGTEPNDTARWLAGREIDQHYHVRSGSDADFARLARSLIGKAIGLALGGGGARGFAHIGVLQAFEELGIPIDFIGGTSMGAIIAGLYAQGLDAAEIRRWCRRYAGAQLDFTFPAVALIAGRKIGEQFRALFGDRQIEDLPLPYFAVSTNLTRGEQVVHRSGGLRHAVRASMSLPGIMPPARQGDDLLVDGGLINNVPVDVIRDLCGGGPMIGIDVSQAVDLHADPRLTTELSGWKLLRRRLNPFAESIPVPGILGVLSRATVVGSVAALKHTRALADLYLELPLDDCKLLEFEAIDAIAEKGYTSALEPLRAWRRPKD